MFASVLVLLALIWLPVLIMGLYLGIRAILPIRLLPMADTVCWWLYIGGLVGAMIVFVWEIVGWQMSLLARLLWCVGLGVPILALAFVMLMSSIMLSGSWGLEQTQDVTRHDDKQ